MSWDAPDQFDDKNEGEEMARVTDPYSADAGSNAARAGSQPVKRSLEGKFVCPFCGSINSRTDEPCPSCGMENTPATRNSTRGRVGPWYVLQKRNPAAPGMKFETLIKFIRKGRIQPRAILRGPTTSQLWRFAATVKGVSREFGLCYNCGGEIEVIADTCPHCSRDQRPPVDPNALLETAAAAAPRPARPQPVVEEADTAEAFDFAESAPAAPAPRVESVKKPVPAVSPTVVFSNQSLSKSEPEVSLEERDRREIEAGRQRRADAPRDPNKSTPTLSAKELATAFQLDFTPSNRKRRRKTSKWAIAFVLLLIIAGAGAAAWFKVPQAHDWMLNTYTQANDKIQSLINGPQTPSNKSTTPTLNNYTFDPSAGKSTTPLPSAVTPTPPTPQATAPEATSPKSSTPTVAMPVKPAPPPAPPAPTLTLDQAYALEQKLWRQALDSEAAGDFASAVKAFEQIKQLPAKAQPSSIDMRLADAKAKLGR